jgi:Uma2 family endonuclease
MSSAILSPPIPPATPMKLAVAVMAPRPKRWTCDEFHQLGDEGWFEESRVMLIQGEILEMPVPNPPHTTAKSLTEEVLRAIFATGFLVRAENPLLLGRSTDPVPDLAVVRGSIRDYARSHPNTAVLVVEVSDSSLDYDTDDKASLYASAGIADYWVVDLVNRRLIVHRDPQADGAKRFDFGYANVTAFLPGQSVSPVAAAQATVAVADLMP